MTTPGAIPREEMAQVTLENLLANRELQRDIHLTTQETWRNEGQNPVVLFRTGENPCPQPFYGTFLIADREQVYFFPPWTVDQPDYLRPEDVVPSGQVYASGKIIPFTKQLWRVNVRGGHPEKYDAKKREFVKENSYSLLMRAPTDVERRVLCLTKRYTLFDSVSS